MINRAPHAPDAVLLDVCKPATWPRDEAEEVFIFRALEELGALSDIVDGKRKLKLQILHSLQRGELEAIGLDAEGKTRAIEAHRWKGESADQIMRSGRIRFTDDTSRQGLFVFTEGYVYVQRNALERFSNGMEFKLAPSKRRCVRPIGGRPKIS